MTGPETGRAVPYRIDERAECDECEQVSWLAATASGTRCWACLPETVIEQLSATPE